MLERYFLSNATTDNSNTVGSFQGFNDLLREKISINITLRNRNMRERELLNWIGFWLFFWKKCSRGLETKNCKK